jgi:hypothetical protein
MVKLQILDQLFLLLCWIIRNIRFEIVVVLCNYLVVRFTELFHLNFVVYRASIGLLPVINITRVNLWYL